MTISPRTRLGAYEIRSPLGNGGMGEVYRAWDTRLERDVAIKVLPARLSSDAARLERFEREARSASALNHPNIVTIYEVGRSDSTSFIVMELVDGKTLRELSRLGPLPLRRLLSIAAQLADGLAKAHASGIVHRDIKPENVMITGDGFVKILDFGLAKLAHPDSDRGGERQAPTIAGPTEAGVVLGTVDYMSPEQAVGLPVDFRSDQFSFGSVLYELVTGNQAFARATGPETMAAIIREEPERIADGSSRAPVQLRWIVERCLAKDPHDRYAATEDLARDLATLRDNLSGLSGAAAPLAGPARRSRKGAIGLAAALLAMMAGIYLLGRRVERSHTSSAGFRQLTFRNAGISSARFTPDGQTVVYSAQSEGKPPELFTTRLDSAETRSLDLTRAEILSISSSGKMALLLAAGLGLPFRAPHSDLPGLAPNRLRGMLAEAPLAGGAPRELLEETYSADWSPDGKSLAVVRFVDGKNRLEFPAGRVLFESEIIVPRISISPSGDQVAFAIRRNLYVTEPGGRVRDLHERALEVAWCRTTNEIWFNSIESGTTNLFAIVPGRQKRRVTTLPGDFVLHDISADGRVLLARTSESSEIFGDFPGESRPRNLSHLDRSMAVDLAPSGGDLLFNEVGQSDRRGTYLGRTDGSPPKRLADCFGWALSPDGKFVLGSPRPDPQILLIPTGAGQPKLVDTPGLRPGGRMGFFPDGRRIWFMAEDAQHKRRVWVQDLSGGKPLAATPPGVGGITLSGDGRFFCAARAVDGDWYLFSTEATETHKVVGLLPGEEPTQWTADGKLLYVRTADELRPGESAVIARVYRLDPRTGRRELWKEIPPANTSGAEAIGAIFFSADGKTCVYTRHRYTSELFLVEGLK